MTTDTITECGCCEGLSFVTPVDLNNRPGLPQINYRIGTHSRFKETMLARLSASDPDHVALSGLRTRSDDDFSVAYLDAWAALADVLTFYQERIANESYLRTATERKSLMELARLIGYAPRPGIAATVKLAFTLEDVPNGPEEVVIPAGTKVQSIPGPDEMPQTFETVEEVRGRVEWNSMRPRLSEPQNLTLGATRIWTTVGNIDLLPGDRVLLITSEQSQRQRVARIQAINSRNDLGIRELILDNYDRGDANYPVNAIFAFRLKSSLFGHNAPNWSILPPERRGENWENRTLENEQMRIGEALFFPFPGYARVFFDTTYPGVVPGNRYLLLNYEGLTHCGQVLDVDEVSRSDFALSAKVTTITIDVAADDVVLRSFKLRETTLYTRSEQLILANTPIETRVGGNYIDLDWDYDGLREGQRLLVSGMSQEINGEEIARREIITLKEITKIDNRTRVVFVNDLQHVYRRNTVTINANVALATHGEQVIDILGSGDATQAFQRFSLRQQPLTYLTAANTEGARSTFELRVNDLLWHDVPTLYNHGSNDRVYVTKQGDDGKTSVQFGDGKTGARLPPGIENVRAKYRKGIGRVGLVRPGQISLLQTRPLGVRGVTNPLASHDAQDPENRDEMRVNAPLTVLTLGRIVSLRDYEDFARSFSGISKAFATWTWDGEKRAVFVTVAGTDGAEVQTGGELYTNLLTAMQSVSDPYTPLRLVSFRKALFRLAAKILIDSGYLAEKVTQAVRIILQENYGFAKRMLGQPIFQSDVIATIQSVSGILAVDLDLLHRTQEQATLQHQLLAERPQSGNSLSASRGAEMLVIDPQGIRIEVL